MALRPDEILHQGLAHHQTGQLDKAEALYRTALRLRPDHSEGLHLLGVLASQRNQPERAAALFRLTVALRPDHPGFCRDLAAMQQAVQGTPSLPLWRAAAILAPGEASLLFPLGLAFHAAGRIQKAFRAWRAVLALDPRSAEACINLGTLHYGQGDWAKVAFLWRTALHLAPGEAGLRANLASLLQERGRPALSEKHWRIVLDLDPGNADACSGLGVACQAQDRPAEAEAIWRRATRLQPDHAPARTNLAGQLLLRDPGAAAAAGRIAAALRPDLPEPYINLGTEAAYRAAIALRPDSAEAHAYLCAALQRQGRLPEAAAAARTAIGLAPDLAAAHLNLALCLLQQGDFAAGWEEYRWRWRTAGFAPDIRRLPLPVWAPSVWNGTPPAGRLLIWGEQGVGDEVMYAGLLPELSRRLRKAGTDCVLECDPRLVPLFARSFPEVGVFPAPADREAPAPVADAAAHLPLADLARLLWPADDGRPFTATAYLRPDPERRAALRSRYTADSAGAVRLVAGLAWRSGNPVNGPQRSLPLSRLGPLLQIPGVRWVSLQYGDPDILAEELRAELAGLPASVPPVLDADVDQRSDLDGFAAQVAAMDLVVSVDNSTVHIAGALGIPTWVLLPQVPDWRWLTGQSDNLWYPSVCLFGQDTPGDWTTPIRQAAEALERFVAERAHD